MLKCHNSTHNLTFKRKKKEFGNPCQTKGKFSCKVGVVCHPACVQYEII
jgi:hypothetical protein